MKTVMIASHIVLLLVIAWQNFAINVAWKDVEQWQNSSEFWHEQCIDYKINRR